MGKPTNAGVHELKLAKSNQVCNVLPSRFFDLIAILCGNVLF